MQNSHSHTRRGSLMVEMVVCSILLTVAVSVLVPGIHAIAAVRKTERFESLATIELNNVATLLQWHASLKDGKLSDSFQRRFSDAELTVEEIEVTHDDSAAGKMQPVRITITRPGQLEQPDMSRQLTIWLNRSGQTAPNAGDE